MDEFPQNHFERLHELNLVLRQRLEKAETAVPLLNMQIDQIASIELVGNTLLLGNVVYRSAYNFFSGIEDSEQVLQAAMKIPGGLGIIRWDSEDFVEAQRGPTPEMDAVRLFITFDECTAAEKALILPQVESLLAQMWEWISPPGCG